MKHRLALIAWFIFSVNGESVVEEARLVSSKPYPTAEECAEIAKLLQGPSLAPFFYCVGSEKVSELPPIIQPPIKVLIEGGGRK